MISQKFYTELGKLLYTIAKADGVIQAKEEKAIEKFIKKELHHHKSYHNDNPENKEIILTKLSFYNAEKENLGIMEALQSYKSFQKKYGNKLDEHQKKIASTLILRVAFAFKGMNENERKLIEQLAVIEIT